MHYIKNVQKHLFRTYYMCYLHVHKKGKSEFKIIYMYDISLIHHLDAIRTKIDLFKYTISKWVTIFIFSVQRREIIFWWNNKFQYLIFFPKFSINFVHSFMSNIYDSISIFYSFKKINFFLSQINTTKLKKVKPIKNLQH